SGCCGSAGVEELLAGDDGARGPGMNEQLVEALGGGLPFADGGGGGGDVVQEPVGQGGEGVRPGAPVAPGQATVGVERGGVERAVLSADPDLGFEDDLGERAGGGQ